MSPDPLDLHKAMTFQPIMDRFSLEVWQQGLKEALMASPNGGLQLEQGNITIRAVYVTKPPNPTVPLGVMVYIQHRLLPIACGIAHLLADDTQTFHVFETKNTLEEVTDLVEQLIQRFSLMLSTATYPQGLQAHA